MQHSTDDEQRRVNAKEGCRGTSHFSQEEQHDARGDVFDEVPKCARATLERQVISVPEHEGGDVTFLATKGQTSHRNAERKRDHEKRQQGGRDGREG